jgi:hypothetical protein
MALAITKLPMPEYAVSPRLIGGKCRAIGMQQLTSASEQPDTLAMHPSDGGGHLGSARHGVPYSLQMRSPWRRAPTSSLGGDLPPLRRATRRDVRGRRPRCGVWR